MVRAGQCVQEHLETTDSWRSHIECDVAHVGVHLGEASMTHYLTTLGELRWRRSPHAEAESRDRLHTTQLSQSGLLTVFGIGIW